jgi:hypothetical protein
MNSNISIIELLLVGSIVVCQLVLAARTFRNIRLLGNAVPQRDFFRIDKFYIPVRHLNEMEPETILQRIHIYDTWKEQPDKTDYWLNTTENKLYDTKGLTQVALVNPREDTVLVFKDILFSINVYLLKNKGAVADFNLVKDIAERNIDTEEDSISQMVTVPLYLGLMGTMVGIVFGLIHLFLVSDVNADFDIKAFLGGVSIAMFASFFGLFCTVVNSNFAFKSARVKLEMHKNGFYTFIQTRLLPVLNQSVSSSIYTLNQSLINFNSQFSDNLNNLGKLLTKNHDALIAQERILDSLEKININEFAKANITILQELKSGIGQLSQFNQYLNSLNYLVSGTSRLSTSFEELLNRSNNFQDLAVKLDNRIEDSNKLVQFLNDHFQQLDARGMVIRESVVKIEDVMIKSLNQLEEHTQHKIEAIKNITVKEEDLLIQAFAENRSHIAKLSLLETLNKHMEDMKNRTATQLEWLKSEAADNQNILASIHTELKLLNKKRGAVVEQLGNRILKWFKR